MVKLAVEHNTETIEMRQAYVNALIKEAENDERIITLDCDLSNSIGTNVFAKAYPERAFNCGIQEANACGVAAGMSSVGFIPFVHSFAVFTSRRMCDQIFISCAYAGLNVKLIGGDAGVSAAMNGGTHMAFEDFGVLRSIPGITLMEATDSVMMKALVPQIAQHYGVDYLRMPRKKIVKVYEEGSEFKIGKAVLLKEGTDVTIIASGVMVSEALEAAKNLESEGLSVRVVDMFTVKPVDEACIIESAGKTGAVVTAENHNVIGGLGSAVAEVLVKNCPVPVRMVGIKDCFGEVGSQEYLMEHFEINAASIYKAAREVIKNKYKEE